MADYDLFYMGGIAGKVAGAFTLKNCINRGNLTAAVERDIAGIAVSGDDNAVFDGCENYGDITAVANHKTDKWRPIVAGIVAIENDKVTTITNCTCKCTIDATLYQATSVGAVYVFQKTWERVSKIRRPYATRLPKPIRRKRQSESRQESKTQ